MRWALYSLVVLFAGIAFAVLWPSIEQELQLLYHCHLNTSHLAQENARLVNEVNKKRLEIEKMREEMRQCKNDVENEYSAANRNYWYGVNVAVLIIAVIVTVLFFCCLYLCCVVVPWYSKLRSRQSQPSPVHPPRYSPQMVDFVGESDEY